MGKEHHLAHAYGKYPECAVVIMAGESSHTKELVTHTTVNLRKHRPALCCAAHLASPSGLCWAAQMPWLQDSLSQITVTGLKLKPAHCNILHADQVDHHLMLHSLGFPTLMGM